MPTRFDPGTGGLIFIPQEKQNEVIITSIGDIPSVIESTKVYFIDGWLDLGSLEITIPTGGMYLSGHGYGISGLFSTVDGHTMFKTGVGSYAGDLIANGLSFYTTGVGSKLFNYDNDGNNSAIEFNSVNMGVFGLNTTTSLGSISDVRQLRTGDYAAINYADGITFNGTIGGIAFNDSILLANIAGTTFLKEGVGLSVTNGMTSDMNALSLNASSVWCDFQESNFATGAVMALNNFRTTVSGAISNLSSKSIKARFKGCTGIANTFVGASWVLTSEVETSITANKTLTKLLGTTTADLDAHFSMPENNRLQYNGEKDIKVDILSYGQLSSSSSESFAIEVRQWDASAGAWIDRRTVPIETVLKILGDRRGGGTVIATALMSTGDYIELHAMDASATGTANPTLTLQSTLTISERQS